MSNNQIALLARAPELESPIEAQGKALKIRSMMNNAEASEMDMQAKRDSIQRAAGLRSTLADFKPDASAEEQVATLTRGGYLTEARSLAESSAKVNKDKREAEKAELTNHFEKFKLIGQILGGVKDQATYDAARQQAAATLGPEAAAKMPAQYDPDMVAQRRAQAQDVEGQLAQVWKQKGFDLDVQKSNESTRHNKATESLTARVQNMTDARAKEAAARASSGDGLLPQETVSMMAQQYLAGDTSVMQNLGRGAQGAQNIIKLRNEIARQTTEAGKGGADLAAQNAEYFGTKAGQRSAGTRIANVEMAVYEAKNLMPMAREASAAVARSGLLPFGKGQVMFNEQTNDPAMRRFAAANNALVNVYSRAISPSGVPTVADKEHAREMISTAMNHDAYMAVVDQMEMELTAAQAAPQQVREAFNAAVTGKGGHGKPAAKPAGASGGAKPSLDDIFGKK